MKKVYKDAFVLHDETIEDPHEIDEIEEKLAEKGGKLTKAAKITRRSTKTLIMADTRQEMDKTWTKFFKYQPLWKIRNYFGEKIALYFAWSGTLITTLWIPTLFGISVFFYGLYLRYVEALWLYSFLFVKSPVVDVLKNAAVIQSLIF